MAHDLDIRAHSRKMYVGLVRAGEMVVDPGDWGGTLQSRAFNNTETSVAAAIVTVTAR
jgi:hypothetical protein